MKKLIIESFSALLIGLIFFLPCTSTAKASTGDTTTFNYTGSVQYYDVPAGVTQLIVELGGAQGQTFTSGSGSNQVTARGGYGYTFSAAIEVDIDERLGVYVGGTNGWPNGGAGNMPGGGSSHILSDEQVLVVAGAGGGAGWRNNPYGGPPTVFVGGNAGWTTGGVGSSASAAGAEMRGGGATQTAGGIRGGISSDPRVYPGLNGSFMQGGNAASAGGGGGGYYGGGGGGNHNPGWCCNNTITRGPGGGGSSWANPDAKNITHLGSNSGNGYVKITPIAGSAVGAAVREARAAKDAVSLLLLSLNTNLYWDSRKTITTSSVEFLNVSFDTEAQYRYRVNNGNYTQWDDLVERMEIQLGVSAGYKNVTLQLRLDEGSPAATRNVSIWKL